MEWSCLFYQYAATLAAVNISTTWHAKFLLRDIAEGSWLFFLAAFHNCHQSNSMLADC